MGIKEIQLKKMEDVQSGCVNAKTKMTWIKKIFENFNNWQKIYIICYLDSAGRELNLMICDSISSQNCKLNIMYK